jgi:hypothetical protein
MPGGFAVIAFELLFPPANWPSVPEPEAVAKFGQQLLCIWMFGMFNSSILDVIVSDATVVQLAD